MGRVPPFWPLALVGVLLACAAQAGDAIDAANPSDQDTGPVAGRLDAATSPESGTVAQVVMAQTRDQETFATANTGNGTIVTPLTLTISPKAAGNRIILEWVVNGEAHHNTVYLASRNGDLLPGSTDANNSRWAGIAAHPFDDNQNSTPSNVVVRIIDMDSLAAESAYELRVRSSDGNNRSFHLNRPFGSAGADGFETGLSVGTATEIWQ